MQVEGAVRLRPVQEDRDRSDRDVRRDQRVGDDLPAAERRKSHGASQSISAVKNRESARPSSRPLALAMREDVDSIRPAPGIPLEIDGYHRQTPISRGGASCASAAFPEPRRRSRRVAVPMRPETQVVTADQRVGGARPGRAAGRRAAGKRANSAPRLGVEVARHRVVFRRRGRCRSRRPSRPPGFDQPRRGGEDGALRRRAAPRALSADWRHFEVGIAAQRARGRCTARRPGRGRPCRRGA